MNQAFHLASEILSLTDLLMYIAAEHHAASVRSGDEWFDTSGNVIQVQSTFLVLAMSAHQDDDARHAWP